jgi:hypothetical protein
MLDVMIDLESMGTTPDSAIVGIGAVEFDLSKGLIGDTFYRCVNLADATRRGCSIHAGTVAWWLAQSQAAQQAIIWNTNPLDVALDDFAAFIGRCGDRKQVRVWGKGPSVDNAMLAHAYYICEKEVPWMCWNDRCVRTISALYKNVEPDEFEGEKHNAADDALAQVRHLIKIRNFVKERTKR